MMRVHLQYGTEGLDVDFPGGNITVLEPRFLEGLADEAAGFKKSVTGPIGSPPLREIIDARDRVAIVIPDITRPFPSDRVLPWLFEELAHVPPDNFTIVNGTGSHRANTDEELAAMVGPRIVEQYRVVNHDSYDAATLAPVGRSAEGEAVLLNKEYVAADKRIVMGFVEPHFIAGFSGGYKAVFPGITDIESIMRYHGASVIGDERSTWGLLDGNPTQERIRHSGSLVPVDFCVNLALNSRHEITRFFCGDITAAHEEACRFVKETSMVPCEEPFPVVVTTNGGYPLDQNLYQAVKGMSAGAQIVTDGGLVVAASRCNDGFPSHGNFSKLLFDHDSPQAILDTILAPGFSMYDQWEAQLLAMILVRARVALYSEIADDEARRAHLEPVSDIGSFVSEELRRYGPDTPVAVLPEGPMTIPFLTG